MNIRKHWKKILLLTAAAFWAGCGDDGSSQSATGIPDVNDKDQIPESSASNQDSSSDAVESSSGAGENSSSAVASKGPYRLASDTTVSCAYKSNAYSGCLNSGGSDYKSPAELQQILEENQTYTLEELNEFEDDLLMDEVAAPVYGVPSGTSNCIPTGFVPSYECSNGKVYNGLEADKDSLLYTAEEFEKKYGGSSSSVQESSSSETSSSSATPPSPLCQKSGFVDAEQFMEELKKDADDLIDSAKTANGGSATDDQSKCLSSIVPETSLAAFKGKLAKNQTCDGETAANPLYQSRLAENKSFVNKQLDSCLKGDSED